MIEPEKLEATEQLVRRAQSGDRAVFGRLVERFHDPLATRIETWRRFQIGLRLETEEILQETFVRVLRSLDGFQWKGEDAFVGWLSTVAKHALADAARRARREALGRVSGVSPTEMPDPGPSASRIARREERFERLESALDHLPDDYREVLKLARLEGLTLKEIGERMDRTPNAVKHLLARAIRELKKQFGETGSIHLPDRRLEPRGGE